MAIFREDYLKDKDEQISAQKRRESNASGLRDVLILGGTVAGLIFARKKILATRTFSQSVKSLGKAAEPYKKYVVQRMTRAKELWPKRVSSTFGKWWEELTKPLPTRIERLNAAVDFYKKQNPMANIPRISMFENLGITERTGIGKITDLMFKGSDIAAIAPRASLGIHNVRHPITGKLMKKIDAGAYGGIFAGDKYYRFGRGGKVNTVITDLERGFMGYPGAGAQAGKERTFEKTLDTFEDYVRVSRTPGKKLLEEESKKVIIDQYMDEVFVGQGSISRSTSLEKSTLKEYVDEFFKISTANPDIRVFSPKDLFKAKEGAIRKSYEDTLRGLIDRELKNPAAKKAYKLYRAQVAMGFGEPFARPGAGVIQGIEKGVKELGEFQLKHPISGRLMPAGPRKYIEEGVSLSGMWDKNIPGAYYLYPKGEMPKRVASTFFKGTIFDLPLQELFGVGVSVRPTAFSSFMSKTLGATSGSWGEYLWRGHIGPLGRVLGLMGATYYGYKTISYLARQTTGWGPTDITGKAYTSARELQQNLINQVGLTEIARKTEKAFPGTIKSPISYGVRAGAPLWMGLIGKKAAGTKGARIGLAMGLAFALITWGDITQDPEELHKIFTGEQDIPVRKGRYWPFGRTPFAGGKINYWRPHWYPMLRSRYKYKGQLWESETEEMAQGTPLSPILAPLLQGKMWDPYYWEKKHYYDRPYPITGELFEPTMPFSWLGNMTIGQLIKPQRPMHPGYSGVAQTEAGSRDMIAGAGGRMGMGGYEAGGMLPQISPDNPEWQASMLSYTLTEQMGLRGFMLQQVSERITGRPDFLPEGPIMQSARRATGFERAYWDMNIGDPFMATEFFRRILPHRRRGIDEYNPIKNTMPDWLPGEEYYKDFQHGDPYTKIEMGEARLPGPGYESLHRLHSGIPDVYDAVDRFLILSDVAPYSNEYKQYEALARGMTRKDKYWSEEVRRHAQQRSKTQKEFDFLELEPSEEVTGPLRDFSLAYRHSIAFLTHNLGKIEAISPIAPVSKYFPYKTAVSTYKSNRMYGSEFTSWGNPVRDFIAPFLRGVTGRGADIMGMEYIPGEEQKRREYEDYFDKIKYIKNTKLAELAMDQGKRKLASRFKSIAKNTMTSVDAYGNFSDMYGAIPKRERGFLEAFASAKEEDRDEILDMVPEPMQKLYKAQWNMQDAGEGLDRSYDVGKTTSRDTVDYFKHHHLPSPDWTGWHPDVDLKDVQLRVVRNEGMNIHNFNLWESQERAMMRRPFVPTIEDIQEPTSGIDLSNLQNMLYNELENQGFANSRIHITRTPSITNSARMKFKVKRNRGNQYRSGMEALRYG